MSPVGFWEVKAKDLREGDEVSVNFLGRVEILSVLKVEPADNRQTRVLLEWGWAGPRREPSWHLLKNNEPLMVRR